MRVAAARASSDQMRLISRRAPTSTPRVGSIRIRIARLGGQPARDLHLLLVAAATACATSASIEGALMLERVAPGPERAAAPRATSSTPCARRRRRDSASRCCRRSTARRSGSRGDPAPSGRGRAPRHRPGWRSRRRSPSTQDLALAPARPGPEDRQRRLDAAGAEQPEQADDLALGARRGRARRRALPPPRRRRPRARDARRATAPGCARPAARLGAASVADHLGDDLVRATTASVRCSPRIRPSRITTMRSAMAKTSARRCDTKMIATPRAFSARSRSNSRCDLVLGQRRGRLVEDQQPRLLGERPGDHDELLGGKIERGHRRAAGRRRARSRASARLAPRQPRRRRRSCPSASARR